MMLKLANIPPGLRHLQPLAEKFGIVDDWAREELVANSSFEELQELKRAVEVNENAFDLWLAGPVAAGPDYSDEHVAFSALRMAADLA